MTAARAVLIVNINPAAATLAGCHAIRRALRRLVPGLAVEVRHWPRVNAVNPARYAGVVVGPNDTPFPAYPPAFEELLAWLRRRRGPTLGICGGHQALALAHGAPVGPVFDVAPALDSYAGMPKIAGDVRVRLLGDPDPLLAGLPEEITVRASHVDEVKELPRGFRVLAIGDPCNVQIMRADRRPLYGVQFHPEKRPGDGDPAGTQILRNFLAMV